MNQGNKIIGPNSGLFIFGCSFVTVAFPREIFEACSWILRNQNPELGKEWGGVLLGDDEGFEAVNVIANRGITVLRAINAPPDSFASPSDFVRGQLGLNELLNFEAEQGRFYVGEFHSHPSGDLTPSIHDQKAMIGIGNDPGYHQHTPILVIFDQAGTRFSPYAYQRGTSSLSPLVRLA